MDSSPSQDGPLRFALPGATIRAVTPSPRNTSSINALIRGVVVLLAPALASAGSPPGDLQEDAARLERLSAALFDLEEADLEARVASLRAEDEAALIEAMMLRAGRAVPPGVGVARAALRKGRAEESLDWLRAELSNEAGDPGVVAAIERALAAAGGTQARRPLVGAAIETAARLDLVELSPALAQILDVDDAGLRAAARDALRRLTGRDLESSASFAALSSELEARGLAPEALRISRDALLDAQARADRAVVKLVEVAPASVEGSPFELADAALAAAAARHVSAGVGEGRLAPDAARALLVAELLGEQRPLVLHARVEALLDLTQGADPAGDVVKGARALLRQLGGEGLPGGARSVSPDRAWIVLGALPRLDRGEGAPADAARVEDFRQGATLLDALLRSRRNAPLDPDGLEGSIAALIDLGRSISDVELRRAAVRGFVLDLKDLLPAAQMMPLGVRRAAARGLALSIEPADAEDILQRLGEPAAREIEYELLGALRGAIAVLDPAGEQAKDVVATLFAALAEDDFDSRSSACAVLLSSDVAPALRAQPLDLRWRWLAKRIPAEPSPELRRELLALLGRTGGTEAAAALLADDAVLDLCVLDGAPFIEALGAAFLELAAEDASALLAASGTLLGVPLDPSGAGAEALLPARAALLRAGLALDLAAFRANANVLAREDHLRALSAALELQSLGAKAGLAALEAIDLSRIVSAHAAPLAPELGPAADPQVARAVHAVRALAGTADAASWPEIDLADETAAGRRAQRVALVLADFDRAAAIEPADAALGAGAWSPRDLEMEAVRFLESIDRRGEALERLDQLIDRERAAADGLSARTARGYLEVLSRAPVALAPARAERAGAALSAALADAMTREEDGPAGSDVDWFASVLDRAADGGGTLRAALVAAGAAEDRLAAVDAWLSGASSDESEVKSP